MSKTKHETTHDATVDGVTHDADGVTRGADGLVIDAYSDDSLKGRPHEDALDADVLVSDAMLDGVDVATQRDDEIEFPNAIDIGTTNTSEALDDTTQGGLRSSEEHGIGTELTSIDDLARSTIGEQSPHRRVHPLPTAGPDDPVS